MDATAVAIIATTEARRLIWCIASVVTTSTQALADVDTAISLSCWENMYPIVPDAAPGAVALVGPEAGDVDIVDSGVE